MDDSADKAAEQAPAAAAAAAFREAAAALREPPIVGGPPEDEDNDATEDEEEDEEEENGMDVEEDHHHGAAEVEEGEISDDNNNNNKEAAGADPQVPEEEATTAPHEDHHPEEENNQKPSEAEHPTFDEEAAKNAEAAYSTRGRSGDAATSALDLLAESSHREAEVHLPREKEQAPPVGPSFLSDSLTEEERRTRTRYIPNVDGMNALRKQEIKGDLALARCMTTSVGVASSLGRKSSRRSREDEMMDVDDTVAPSDDDRATEILRLGKRTMDVCEMEHTFPSAGFLAPPPTGLNGVDSSSSNNKQGKPHPPTVVESVTAFNPPRPPESVGPKKKHRMLRWERRPADIEVDLNTYRKTVQKTREELKKAMEERDRIEMMDNHLRRHFLNHLECMNEEFQQCWEETAKVQQECARAADLLTSRTRSRGAGKSSYVMRDVLTVLRTRGTELQGKGHALKAAATVKQPRGVGGVGAKSFARWEKTSPVKAGKPCSGWTASGDKVVTPYGEGKVINILPAGKLNPSELPLDGKPAAKTNNAGDGQAMDVDKNGSPAKDAPAQSKASVGTTAASGLDLLVAPRVAVQLSFGVGYFPPDAVESVEDPSSFSDSRLATRWRGLQESAPLFGESLDVEAMEGYRPNGKGNVEGHHDGEAGSESNEPSDNGRRARLLPFGSDLIPTSVGRGAAVSRTDIGDLDRALHKAFFGSTCVLGRPDNPGVPSLIKEAEEKQSDRIVMKAKLRQLKNEVNRQRRIRQLNQRTYAATQERAARIESLVSEMRTDLRSLKRRLDEEVDALGIDDAEAEKIMLAYYNREGSADGEDSPFKRSRKNAEMDLDTEDDEEGGFDHMLDGSGSPPQEQVPV